MSDHSIVQQLHAMNVNILPYIENNQKGISAAVRLLLAAKRPIITTDYLYFSDLKDEVYKMPDAEADTIESSLSSLV